MSNTEFEDRIVKYIRQSIETYIKSIAIIGSYTIERRIRAGSDIDVVVVVDNLNNLIVNFDNIFYKQTSIDDSQGKRIELNTKLDDVVIDITIIDRFNSPNNPLTDWYENHLGWCEYSLCIYGVTFSELFDLKRLKKEYENIRGKRLSLVEEKIKLTERKIKEQARRDLHIIYELQRYIFIREVIKRKLFNRFSLKHPGITIPDFNQIFCNELRYKCCIKITIVGN